MKRLLPDAPAPIAPIAPGLPAAAGDLPRHPGRNADLGTKNERRGPRRDPIRRGRREHAQRAFGDRGASARPRRPEPVRARGEATLRDPSALEGQSGDAIAAAALGAPRPGLAPLAAASLSAAGPRLAAERVAAIVSDARNPRFRFQPTSLSIRPGDVATRMRRADEGHDAMRCPGDIPEGADGFKRERLTAAGRRFSHVCAPEGSRRRHRLPLPPTRMAGEGGVGRRSKAWRNSASRAARRLPPVATRRWNGPARMPPLQQAHAQDEPR